MKLRIAALVGGFLFLGGCVSPQTAGILIKRSAAAAQLYTTVKSDTCRSLSPTIKV